MLVSCYVAFLVCFACSWLSTVKHADTVYPATQRMMYNVAFNCCILLLLELYGTFVYTLG